MTEEKCQIGRLAMRQEGGNWNAYYALPDSMKDALLLGSIKMNLVMRNKTRKEQFMNLMRECVSDIIEDNAGIRPTWGGEHNAPEHERAGHG